MQAAAFQASNFQVSIFLAKLLGPVFVAMGLAVVLNRGAPGAEFLGNHALISLSGVLALAGGIAIVLVHNVWTSDWRVIITVSGWLLIVSGLVRVLIPQVVAAIGGAVLARSAAAAIGATVWIALGALLCFFGYIRPHPSHGSIS
jgi:hypothetical protein